MSNILQIETLINIFFQQHFAFLNPVMNFFSFLGDEYFFMFFIPVFFWCVNYRTGLRLGVMLMFSNSLNMIMKLGFHTPRPYWVNPEVQALRTETSFGLPSGHSQNSAALWGIFAAHNPRKWIHYLSIFVILMVGLSRIQVGVHYLHDVLLGWALGALLVFLVIKLEKPAAKKFLSLNSSGRLNLAMVLSLLMIFLPLVIILALKNWSLPEIWQNNALLAIPEVSITPLSAEGGFTIAGTTFGTLFGLSLFLEKFKGIPDLKGTFLEKVARYLVGAVGMVIIYFGVKMISPEGESLLALFMRFIRYGLLGAWITAAAPYLFLKMKLIRIELITGFE